MIARESASPEGAAPKIAPSPPGTWLLGHLGARRRDPLGFFLEAASLGGVVRLRFVNKILHLVTEPAAVQRVLQDNSKNYVKGFGYQIMQSVLGQGLVTSDGEQWLQRRRLSAPAFRPERVAAAVDRTAQLCAAEISAWPLACAFDVHEALLVLTQRISAQSFLSLESDAATLELVRDFALLQANITRRILATVSCPIQLGNRAFLRALARVDALMMRTIAERRAVRSAHPDLLQDLMDARDPEGGARFDDRALRDAIVTMFLAGYETTANALTWAFYLLAQHPAVVGRMREEALGVLGPERLPSAADLERLPYARQVLDESQRLFPAVWLFARKARAADVLDGYAIPADSFVLISPWVSHRNPRYWPHPEAFDPERFTPEAVRARPKYVFLPFSHGPRQCIGARFAMQTALILVTLVVRRFDLRLAPQANIAFEPMITLQPKHGMPLLLSAAGTGCA